MRAILLRGALVLVFAGALPAAWGQERMPRYEPSQRLRTAIETCRQDEVMNGAWCVKKCQRDFRLDLKARPPACLATRADAKYVPPKARYQPAQKQGPAGGPPAGATPPEG